MVNSSLLCIPYRKGLSTEKTNSRKTYVSIHPSYKPQVNLRSQGLYLIFLYNKTSMSYLRHVRGIKKQ